MKKYVLKSIFILIVILIIFYFIVSLRKLFIIMSMETKIGKLNSIDNYYINLTEYRVENSEITQKVEAETYVKQDKFKEIYNNNTIFYYDFKNNEKYRFSEKDKTVEIFEGIDNEPINKIENYNIIFDKTEKMKMVFNPFYKIKKVSGNYWFIDPEGYIDIRNSNNGCLLAHIALFNENSEINYVARLYKVDFKDINSEVFEIPDLSMYTETENWIEYSK